jgi:hypothetical protein
MSARERRIEEAVQALREGHDVADLLEIGRRIGPRDDLEERVAKLELQADEEPEPAKIPDKVESEPAKPAPPEDSEGDVEPVVWRLTVYWRAGADVSYHRSFEAAKALSEDASRGPVKCNSCSIAPLYSHETVQRLQRRLRENEPGALQDDLRELMEVLGIPTHARPMSPHRVMQEEVIPAAQGKVEEWFRRYSETYHTMTSRILDLEGEVDRLKAKIANLSDPENWEVVRYTGPGAEGGEDE